MCQTTMSAALILTLNSPNDNRVPASLTYHIADVYLEELDKALHTSLEEDGSDATKEPSPTTPILSLLVPFFQIMARTNTNITYQRIYTSVTEPVLAALRPLPPSSSDPPLKKRPRLTNESAPQNVVVNACVENPEVEGKVEKSLLRQAMLSKIFEVASDSDARDANRRKMYAIWKDAKAEEEDKPHKLEVD